MPTHILVVNGQDTTVTETEDEVVAAVRRDHPNPVKLEGTDGLVEYVNCRAPSSCPKGHRA